MRPSLAIAALPLLFLAACSSDPAPAKVAAPPSVAVTSAAPVQVDPHGAAACKAVAGQVDEIMTEGVVANIAYEANQSTTFDVRISGLLLSDRYDLAVAAGDAASELDVTTAAVKLQTACVKAGLEG
jgi:hypothetical protein